MKTSDNEWRRSLAHAEDRIELFNSFTDFKEIYRKIAEEGSHISLTSYLFLASRVMTIPREYLSKVHFSKEQIRSYYAAWPLKKTSQWKEPLNRHILLLDQAGITKLKREELLRKPPRIDDTEIKPMGLQHLLGLLIFWALGMLIATLIFFAELCIHKAKQLHI